MSGSYLMNDEVAVCWLQLVRTPDNHLTGQLVSSVLKPGGKIDHESVSLTGAVNGENVMLSGGGILGMAQTTLSGRFDGNSLTLSGVPSTPVILKRASLADYQAQLDDQSKRSQTIISARATAAGQRRTLQAEKDFLSHVDRVISQMQRFDAEADVHLGRFPNAEKAYIAVTAKVSEYVTRERQLVGNPSRAVARSQLEVAATQISLNTDQVHFQGEALQRSLETNIAPLVNQVSELAQRCHETQPIGGNLPQAEIEEHKGACNRLLNAAPAFNQKYAAIVAGLSRLENVYKREKEYQAKLLDDAQRLE
ncbi:hypothetical protein [Terriglobus roseus]|uniref:hypothetical protein n=1 Tax=Terriglobus roseus TaxID=392734 RepID=UPI0012EAC26F|nr:hypothetical protein [Terriglobus roseus]